MRVAVAETADAADFAVVDDPGEAEGGACAQTRTTHFVMIAENPMDGAPVIYLSRDGSADYHIFVRSKWLAAREVAALIVGARGEKSRFANASL